MFSTTPGEIATRLTDAPPTTAATNNNRHSLIELELDTPIANLAAKVAQAGKKTTPEALASVENILNAIRSSKVWAGFLELLEGTDVSTVRSSV